MENELLNQEVVSGELKVEKVRNFKMPSRRVVYSIVACVLIVGSLFYFKGLFVAAMVDGSFISRASVIKELEKQSGKAALDSLVITRLVENRVEDIDLSEEELDSAMNVVVEQLKAQGATFEDFLISRGLTEAEFKKRLAMQKRLEKFLADKTSVTEEEITKYTKDNKASLPKGVDALTLKAQITEAIKQEKFNNEVRTLVDSLKAGANIKYFVEY